MFEDHPVTDPATRRCRTQADRMCWHPDRRVRRAMETVRRETIGTNDETNPELVYSSMRLAGEQLRLMETDFGAWVQGLPDLAYIHFERVFDEAVGDALIAAWRKDGRLPPLPDPLPDVPGLSRPLALHFHAELKRQL